MIDKRVIALAALLIGGCHEPQQEGSSVGINVAQAAAEAKAEEGKLWVKSERADMHTCPSQKCGVVNRLMFREAATPIETKDGWTRLSKDYNAQCVNGRIEYVIAGDARCVAANGYVDGKVGEWVETKLLAAKRPTDPAAQATNDEKIVAQSDDFPRYHAAFAKAARDLISEGKCSEQDFLEQGGWLKEVDQHENEPVYFTHCGGVAVSNVVYLNAKTGKIF